MKLKSILAGVALLVGSLCAPAYADHLPAIMPCVLTTTAATICANTALDNNQPGVFYAVVNDSLTAQTATVTCYDNPTAASGTVVASIAALGAAQIIIWPAGGRLFNNGITCQASALPTGAGIEIYVGKSNS